MVTALIIILMVWFGLKYYLNLTVEIEEDYIIIRFTWIKVRKEIIIPRL